MITALLLFVSGGVVERAKAEHKTPNKALCFVPWGFKFRKTGVMGLAKFVISQLSLYPSYACYLCDNKKPMDPKKLSKSLMVILVLFLVNRLDINFPNCQTSPSVTIP
ncbi:MAG: hypothetical protein DRR08_05100 [Candidatus Parabeggiatoa sp. nov. 2]|nr:MAG: hypothetical protein DRR08_05100 [Gammaproteobacteria bacterium]